MKKKLIKLMVMALIGGTLFAILFMPIESSTPDEYLYETYGGLKVWTQDGENFERYNPPSPQWEVHDSQVSMGQAGNTAEAKYYANLSIGSIGAYSYAVNAYDGPLWHTANASCYACFRDALYFTVPAGTYSEGVYATLSGKIEGDISTTDVPTPGTWCMGGSSWYIKFKRVTVPGTPEDKIYHYERLEEGETYSVSLPFTLTIPIIDEGMTLTEPAIVETFVFSSIGEYANWNYARVSASSADAAATADFYNSTQIVSVGVPQGVTWTSASGVFLSEIKRDISGRIGYYSNDEPVDSVLINANSLYSDTTDLNGDYELLNLPSANYVVRPEKENDVTSVISALDAAWILQHGVELRTFTPYQLIAGDVTGNGSVTAYDAARVLQYDVGLINKFPVMPDTTHFWRFVPQDFAITPSNWTTAPDSIAYTPLNSDTTDNYFGIIYGDVTGNWHHSGAGFASLDKSSGETVNIRLEDISGEAGDKVILPVVLENGSDILAMSFTLEYDAKALKNLNASTTELTKGWQMAFNVKEGQIKVALAGIKPIATSGAMVNLEFEVLGIDLGETNSPLNISEIMINEGNIAVNIQSARFTTGAPLPEEYALSQNYPNPFNAQTVIKYQLPKSGRVVLKIYNTLGQEVRTLVDDKKKAGYYQINWDGRNDEGSGVSSGIYIYRIQAGDFVRVRKMLFVM